MVLPADSIYNHNSSKSYMARQVFTNDTHGVASGQYLQPQLVEVVHGQASFHQRHTWCCQRTVSTTTTRRSRTWPGKFSPTTHMVLPADSIYNHNSSKSYMARQVF